METLLPWQQKHLSITLHSEVRWSSYLVRLFIRAIRIHKWSCCHGNNSIYQKLCILKSDEVHIWYICSLGNKNPWMILLLRKPYLHGNKNIHEYFVFYGRRKLPGEWIFFRVPFTYDMHQKNLFLELGPECLNLDFNRWYLLPWHSNAFYNTNWWIF